MLIDNAQVYTPSGVQHGWLQWHGQQIAAIGTGEAPADPDVIDANGLNLLPGFIDLHVHGAVGCDTMDATPDALKQMAQFYAQHGVTGFLPTTWTDSHNRIMKALENIRACMQEDTGGAAILGAHLEGPYLNPEKSGAQHPDFLRRVNPEEAQAILDTEVVRLVALAPEFEENHWLIRACNERGITVSVAHSAATYAQIQQTVALGLSHSTHTFNAQSPLHHREPGIVGAVMNIPTVSCELIADNIHVHPAVMSLLWRIKKPDHLVLISDAVRAAGLPDGEYSLDDRTVVVQDGAVRLADGTLAGSILTMDRALANLLLATDEPLSTLWQTTSLNAARAIGIQESKGSLEIGKDADLVLVDNQVNCQLTVVQGQVVFQ
jgi:N-acetylglucosamine-6-phosphate deacetylase